MGNVLSKSEVVYWFYELELVKICWLTASISIWTLITKSKKMDKLMISSTFFYFTTTGSMPKQKFHSFQLSKMYSCLERFIFCRRISHFSYQICRIRCNLFMRVKKTSFWPLLKINIDPYHLRENRKSKSKNSIQQGRSQRNKKENCSSTVISWVNY